MTPFLRCLAWISLGAEERWWEIINYGEQKSHLLKRGFLPLLPDKITSYTDYVLNLDKLTVFVSEHKLHHLGSGGPVGRISYPIH